MKRQLGRLAVLLLTLVFAEADAALPCMDMLEVTNHGKVVLRSKDCSQRVNQTDLQAQPEVFYHAHLPADHKYILIFFENKSNTVSKRLHWFLTDIVPKNYSLTANSTTVVSYKPPANDQLTNYTFQLYKYPQDFNLKLDPASQLEMDSFIPEKWAEPFGTNVILHHSRTFGVIGGNHTHITTRTVGPDPTTAATTVRPPGPTADPHPGSSTPPPNSANSPFGIRVLIIPILSLVVKSALF